MTILLSHSSRRTTNNKLCSKTSLQLRLPLSIISVSGSWLCNFPVSEWKCSICCHELTIASAPQTAEWELDGIIHVQISIPCPHHSQRFTGFLCPKIYSFQLVKIIWNSSKRKSLFLGLTDICERLHEGSWQKRESYSYCHNQDLDTIPSPWRENLSKIFFFHRTKYIVVRMVGH